MNPSAYNPRHFQWRFADGVATVTLDRPEKKNPLTFDSYAELRDTFRALGAVPDVRAVVVTGAGGNFCSGGDVNEIIGPLVNMPHEGLANFTRMTGDLVIAMMECPQIIVAAIDGVCAGAGAAIAMASDLRLGTARSRVAFLFVRVGLAGCDMGACAVLPRLIGHGRAAELLYTGRAMPGDEAHRWGFFNRLCEPDALQDDAHAFARELAAGPITAHRATKRQLLREWDMAVLDAVRMEADVQAQLMETRDFRRAYEAFARRETPRFEGD
ncbi:MAG TPA: enoyl-CoA hydratase family protein [Candidatus Krumholzibacteria bacterium]